MTSNRLAIAVILLVVFLYAVSTGVGSRNHDRTRKIDLDHLWLKRFVPAQKFDLAEIAATNGWDTGRWTLPKGLAQATLEIKPSSGKPVRNLLVSVAEDGPCQVDYAPRSNPHEAGKYADDQAAPLRIQNLAAGKPPFKLTILPHGGTLTIQRLNPVTRAVLKLE